MHGAPTAEGRPLRAYLSRLSGGRWWRGLCHLHGRAPPPPRAAPALHPARGPRAGEGGYPPLDEGPANACWLCPRDLTASQHNLTLDREWVRVAAHAPFAPPCDTARGTRSLEPKWHRRPLVSVYRLPSRHAWHCQASQTDRQEAAARMHAAPRPRGPGRGPRVRAGTSRAALHPERRSLLSAPPRATPDNDYSEAGPPALPCQPQLEPRRHRG